MLRMAVLALLLGPILAACGSSFGDLGGPVKRGAFTSDEYGVAASPRLTRDRNPPHGGGRYLVGQPYVVHGEVYTPEENPGYHATGTASWYGEDFHGRQTANGEIFSANAITGAHPTLPLPCYVRVTNLANGRSMIVRVNDRGPYVHGRIMDLSQRAAALLGYVDQGMTDVDVQYLGAAPLEGDDTRFLMASLKSGNGEDVRMAGSGRARDPHSLADFAGDFFHLFGYADSAAVAQKEDGAIRDAHDAVNAMATRSPALRQWAETVDEDARKVRLKLGNFTDSAEAERVASSFAVLGAVDVSDVEVRGRAAKHLELTHLRPGVARSDLSDLVHKLGLSGVVLY